MAIQRYRSEFQRLSSDDMTKWRDIPPAIASDSMNRCYAMSGRISPLLPGMKICGHARTITGMVGDNGPAHVAISLAQPGDILVIDARGHIETAVWGGIMTLAAIKQGVAGIVVDGAIRDAEEIRKLRFATFSAGICPAGPSKGFGGIIDGPIACAGTPVNPGDIIIGDDDGVVVVPLERQAEILEKSTARIKNEAQTSAEIETGNLPVNQFGLTIEEIY